MTLNKKWNKKGSFLDLVFIGVVLLVFSIAIIVGNKITNDIADKFAENSVLQSEAPEAITMARQLETNSRTALNSGFLLLTILLGIATLIFAALVRIHPIFIPVYIIALVIFIFLCGMLSNIYQAMAESAPLAATAANFEFVHNIMVYLPLIIGVFGIILMVVMYKLWSIAQ